MHFELLSGKVLPVIMAAFTALAVFGSSIDVEPPEYTVVANAATSGGIELETTEQGLGAAANQNPPTSTSLVKVDDDQEYNDGVYTGSAQGFRGRITVRVTISGGKITKIEVVDSSDDASYFNRAKTLLNRMVNKQSTNVDVVSGATYSSVGLIRATRNALSKAAKSKKKTTSNDNTTKNPDVKKPPQVEPVDETDAAYTDGTYYGIGEGFNGAIRVAVIIKDGVMDSITVVAHEDDESFFSQAIGLIPKMISGQTTNVDTVSGATFSSSGIIEATRNALEQAKKDDTGSDSGGGDDSGDAGGDSGGGDDSGDTGGDSGGGNDSGDTGGGGNSGDDQGDDSGDDDSDNPPEPETIYQNGSYSVTVPCNPDEDDEFDPYSLSMTVTIENDRIIGVSNISASPNDSINRSFIRLATNGVVPRVTSNGSPDGVDTVSGATCSSISIINGCYAALQQALK